MGDEQSPLATTSGTFQLYPSSRRRVQREPSLQSRSRGMGRCSRETASQLFTAWCICSMNSTQRNIRRRFRVNANQLKQCSIAAIFATALVLSGCHKKVARSIRRPHPHSRPLRPPASLRIQAPSRQASRLLSLGPQPTRTALRSRRYRYRRQEAARAVCRPPPLPTTPSLLRQQVLVRQDLPPGSRSPSRHHPAPPRLRR